MSKKRKPLNYLNRIELTDNNLYRIKYENSSILRMSKGELEKFEPRISEWKSVENDSFYNRHDDKCYTYYR